MTENRFPPGWNEEKVRRVIEHYESQSDEEAIAEDDAAYEDETESLVSVPIELVPSVREMIARHKRTA